jgi:hypothetical protein
MDRGSLDKIGKDQVRKPFRWPTRIVVGSVVLGFVVGGVWLAVRLLGMDTQVSTARKSRVDYKLVREARTLIPETLNGHDAEIAQIYPLEAARGKGDLVAFRQLIGEQLSEKVPDLKVALLASPQEAKQPASQAQIPPVMVGVFVSEKAVSAIRQAISYGDMVAAPPQPGMVSPSIDASKVEIDGVEVYVTQNSGSVTGNGLSAGTVIPPLHMAVMSPKRNVAVLIVTTQGQEYLAGLAREIIGRAK